MSFAPPGYETPQVSPPPPPPAPQDAPPIHKEAKAAAAAAKAYAKAQRPWYKRKRLWALGLLLLSIVGYANSETSSTSSDSNVGSRSEVFAPSGGDGADASPSEAASTFENGVLTTPDLRIEITRHKVIGAGQKGNRYGDKPIIAFWFTITNLSGSDVDPMDFLASFTVYQDNDPNVENELDLGYGNDLPTADPLENIKKGGTVEDTAAYELDDLTTPVELVATDGLLGDVLGKATYTLR